MASVVVVIGNIANSLCGGTGAARHAELSVEMTVEHDRRHSAIKIKVHREPSKVPQNYVRWSPMSSAGGNRPLHGRESECETLRDIVSDARLGKSRVLVLRGEAGVGKTALLEFVSQQASGFRRIHVLGVQAEMELAFAGLQRLCTPILDHLDQLPDPQREALTVAFGRSAGPTPDGFMVGIAALSLMAAAADQQPLLCVVDDAQWIDQISMQLLGFVARRLLAEPVALVFAARNNSSRTLSGLPELAVHALSDADARQLLDSVVLGPIDERVRDRIVAETRGIPLALVEVPRNISAAELVGGFAPSSGRPSAGQIEESFIRRVQSLPHQTRQLLLIAAVEPVGDAGLFLRAASRLTIPVDALAPAEAAGVIEFGPRMRFSHPLMRSAAYRVADLPARRAAHRVLADATDRASDPDRWAWHAAHATAGLDDDAATELEASADRAKIRGGIAAAAALLERATTLTSEPSRRSSRALAAAQAKRDATDLVAARELLTVAEMGPLSDHQRAQVGLRAQLEFARSRGRSDTPPVAHPASQLLHAAVTLDAFDGDEARDAYLEALVAAMYAGRLGEDDALMKVAESARLSVSEASQLHRPADLLLSGWVQRITHGGNAGHGNLRAALELVCEQVVRGGQALNSIPLGLAVSLESATAELWDDILYQQLAMMIVRQARQVGALSVLPSALVYQAGVHIQTGEFAMAATLIEEANSLASAVGYSPLKYHTLSLAVWRGTPDVGDLIEGAVAAGRARGEGRVLGVLGCLAALHYNSLGRYNDAFAAAHEACEYEDRGFYSWCLSELVEAAARTGQQQVGAAAVEQLAERAGSSGTDWGLGTLARAQALLADDKDADRLFNEAIERLTDTRLVVHAARSHLVYGEWLRRVRRRGDARRHLGEAHKIFSKMGAQAFAERARRELVATGEKVSKRAITTGDELTAQESQIARLAGDGLTNQEIGAHLFLSPHTVEWHLRKVFAKLGITSRRQLRAISWAS